MEQLASSGADIWMVDISRRVATPLTRDRSIDNFPVWSADDRFVYFSSNRSGRYEIFRQAAAGGGVVERIASSPSFIMRPLDVSRDGRFLVFVTETEKTGYDIRVLALAAPGESRPVAVTPAQEEGATISLDGTRIAYASDESGRFEVYVQSFPEPAQRVQVSTSGGNEPRWSKDGRELFYRGFDGSIFSAAVERSGFGPPVRLFRAERTNPVYDVTADGRRFLLVKDAPNAPPAAPTILVHWQAMLKD